MVMLCGVLFFHPGSFGEQFASFFVSPSTPAVYPASASLSIVNQLLSYGLWVYLFLLPLSYFGIYYNFFVRRHLPEPLQRVLEVYTNFFGIIMWRVFTIDLINFFPNIYRQPRSGGERTLITRYGWRSGSVRFSHVGESITLTCLFTTLKYYPSNQDIFVQRLLRYARTIQCPDDAVLVFEYVGIEKDEKQFAFLTVAEYIVDPLNETVAEKVLNERYDVRAAYAGSPLHEGAKPGSYAPLHS